LKIESKRGERALEITTKMVKELRELTSAGVLECRDALVFCEGDLEEAAAYLREKGLAIVAKKSSREASEGTIEAYVHSDMAGSRLGVMLELNCETDFVAKTDEFQRLAHDLALHIAFAAPQYLARDDVPEQVVEEEKSNYRAEALEEGKPERIVDRIVEGRLEKFYQDMCIMEQPFIKDEDKTVHDLINDAIAKLGENIILRRFVRYQVGETL
jgi:elongation factor Ts